MPRACPGFIGVWLLIAAGAATADPPNTAPKSPANEPVSSPPVPLDQGVADQNPLSSSLRETQSGLREPSGFLQVYPVPGHPDLLMRINGGVYAVFPRSEYTAMHRRMLPLIPANTVFYIGAPPPPVPAPAADDSLITSGNTSARKVGSNATGTRQGRRLDGEIATEFGSPNARSAASMGRNAAPGPTIMTPEVHSPALTDDDRNAPLIYDGLGPVNIVTNHAYRVNRINQLLWLAAERTKPGLQETTSDE